MVERVHRYRDKEPLFETSGVDAEIRSTLDRRVDLPSGGYLVFDYAEAFTVIDVNTGRFVGSRGKSAQGRLEDTIVKNNLEAVKEVVHQLRLRDIGGIIVIDFIDMANPKNRETVEEALRTELERDRTKTYVVEISPLGLVEMTRQNVTDGPREILTNRCPICEGDGVVVSEQTHALEAERKLRAIAKGSRVQAFRVAVHPRVLALLAGPGGSRLGSLEAVARRRFFLVPAEANGHVHLDHFEVLAQGKLDTLRPEAPVAEGKTVELKLVEVGLHDPLAAVGKLDGGYEVVVAGAAKLVGKKVKVTVGAVLESGAFAELAEADGPALTPITFEAEAEKPTRASRAKKAAVAEPAVEPEEEEALAEADAEETEADEEPDAEAAPKKKRTRRGTRGGRGRKKPAAKVASDAAEEAVDGNGRPTPRIHVPPADLASEEPAAQDDVEPASETQEDEAPSEDGQPKRKRSRRGSRGGRKRRKPAAAGEEAASEDDGVAVAAAPDEDEPEYVPMSEWIDDFEARSRG
jgi:ribonuclease G